MARYEVKWNRRVLDRFAEEAMLNEFQINIMKTRIQGMTVREQSIKFHCSESTIHRQIKLMKSLYDEIQKQHPDEFPIRRNSPKEDFMDNN